MIRTVFIVSLVLTILVSPASAQWSGYVDRSAALMTSRFAFTGSPPEAGTSNENYYDGDLGDVNGDRLPDRLLGSRFGLLLNTGGGYMVPARRHANLLLLGEGGLGEDGMQLTDLDGNGELDALMGGNGEPLGAQMNYGGRFTLTWRITSGRHSALNIVNTDVEGDGDVDLAVAHAFCADSACGGPVDFALFINDGTGNVTEQAVARGLGFGTTDYIVGVVSGDIDRDGDFDLLIERGRTSGNALVVARNDGTGNYTQSAVPMPIQASGFGQGTNLGDIDDDGDLDLVTVCYPPVAGKSATVAINDGLGNFTHEPGRIVSTAFGAGDGKLVDVDYDGDLDFVAFDKDNAATNIALTILLNDGTGNFTLDATHSWSRTGPSSGLGADADVADLDGDGTYDLWLGLSGGNVIELFNSYRHPSGLPADMPRNATASPGAGGITVRWNAPPFASTARAYRVYRSLAAGLGDRDRRLLTVVGFTHHQDEAFSAPITRHTTTGELGLANVTVDGAANAISFTDTTAIPGVAYHYAVSHVGGEYQESVQTPPLRARIPRGSATDTRGPEIEILSPIAAEWGRQPRVVIAYGDDESGVDLASLEVSFDRALGGSARAAGANIVDLAVRRDDQAFVAALPSTLTLPRDVAATLTVRLQDFAGNLSTRSVRFFPSVDAPTVPTASFTATPASGSAPLDVALDASASRDPDGAIFHYRWSVSDGRTLLGRNANVSFATAGTYEIVLHVTDNQGGATETRRTITVGMGGPTTDAGVPADTGVLADSGALGDSGVGDARVDGAITADSGTPASDAGVAPDATATADASGAIDTGVRGDSGVTGDAGPLDTGPLDTGPRDTGLLVDASVVGDASPAAHDASTNDADAVGRDGGSASHLGVRGGCSVAAAPATDQSSAVAWLALMLVAFVPRRRAR